MMQTTSIGKFNLSEPAKRQALTLPSCGHGFTLVELMITLVVASILATIAVPSFTYVTQSNQLSTTANAVVQALTTARMAAIQQNTRIAVCADDTCSVTTTGSSPTTLKGAISGISGSVQFSGHPSSLIYTGQGLAYQNSGTTANPNLATTPYNGLVADISSSAISTNNRRCIYMAAGGSVLETCTITSNSSCSSNVPTTCN